MMKTKTLPHIIAHRGLSYVYPEQTSASYKAAIAVGADAIECDVHLTKDQEVICVHDFDLKRVAGVNKNVEDLTLDELKKIDVSAHKGGMRGQEDPELTAQLGITEAEKKTIMTLAELIDLINETSSDVGLIIETKQPSPFGAELEKGIVAVLKEKGMINQDGRLDPRVQFMSFSPDSIKQLKQEFPETICVQLIDSLTDEEYCEEIGITQDQKQELLDMGEANVESLKYCGFGVNELDFFKEKLTDWAQEGISLRCFTVNTQEQFQSLRDELGLENLDYIITDRVDYIRKLLEQTESIAQG
ncbi:MAG: glycerophosphodiester phosphodiesterase family protein [Micrococcaceae bacterium]